MAKKQPSGGFKRKRPKPKKIAERPKRSVTFDEVIVAFQKTLARAGMAAREASRRDADFVLGEKTLYIVDGMDIELKAALTPGTIDDEDADRILVDFDADASNRSIVSFRVESRPLEALETTALQLSNLDPLNLKPDLVELGIVLIDKVGDQFKGRSGSKVTINIAANDAILGTYTVTTGTKGRARLVLDIETGQIDAGGGFKKCDIDFGHLNAITAFAHCLKPPVSSTAITVKLS